MSRGERALPVLAALAFFALYASTRVEVHRFDAAAYMLAAQTPAPEFDPHHLLYTRLAWLVRGLAGPERFMRVMQILSMVCAAAGLGLYCRLLQDLTRGRARGWWAVLGACLLGLSSSFWISAVETDPYGITLMCLIAAAVCYLRAVRRGALAWHVTAGLAVATATLVRQLVVLFTLAYVLGLALGRAPRLVVGAGAFLALAAGIPTAVYLVVVVGRGLVHDVAGLFYWLTTAAHAGYWGAFHRDSVVEGLYGFLYAVAAGAGGFLSPPAVRTSAVVIIVAAASVIARQIRAAVPAARERAAVAFLMACIALYVPFIVWCAPFHSVNWQFVLIPLIAVVVWTAARVVRRAPTALAALAILIALIGTLNYIRVVWPLTLRENDHAGAFVERAFATLPRDARVVAPIGTATITLAARLGPKSVFVVPHAPGTRTTSAEILAALGTFVEAAWAQGRPVWVFANLLELPQGRLSDPVFKAEVRRLLERLVVEGRLVVLPTDLLQRPMRRHPWDVIGS